MSAPAMIGTESISPFCAGERSKLSPMKGAMAPLSTQMQQENEKYRKAANSVGPWPERKKFLKPGMVFVGAKSRGPALWRPSRRTGLGRGSRRRGPLA